jgi:hypothetical protein
MGAIMGSAHFAGASLRQAAFLLPICILFGYLVFESTQAVVIVNKTSQDPGFLDKYGGPLAVALMAAIIGAVVTAMLRLLLP